MTETQDRASQIRDLLGQISGVEGVEVEADPEGGIVSIEIHVSRAGEARRITRNIESALMTGLGMIVDHERIKVVQNGSGPTGNGPEPVRWEQTPARTLPHVPEMEGAEPEAEEGEPLESRRVRLAAVRCVPDGELYVEVTVDLEIGGQFHRGRVRDTDMPRTRMLATARATVGALGSALDEGTALALEGIEEFQVGDARGVLAILRARIGHSRPVYHGAAIVDRDALDATARAVLDALNRFWQARGEAG